MNEYEEFMDRDSHQVYLAIMDRIGVKLDFTNPDESPLWEAARLRREFSELM